MISFFSRLPFGLKCLLGAGCALLGLGPVQAAPDLTFSNFAQADLESLAGGRVLQQRGGLIPFERGLTAQALYVIDAAPAEVAQKLVTWKPSSHPELSVYLHERLPAQPTPADFAAFNQIADNRSVQAAIASTLKLNQGKTELQLSKAELGLLAPAQAQGGGDRAIFARFWSEVLAGRSAAFLAGNPIDLKFETGNEIISPYSEIKSLMRSDVLVFRRFRNLLLDTAPFGGTKAVPTTNYYDAFDIQGEAAIGIGSVFQQTSGDGILSVDMEYFVGSGIYVSVELEALFPVTVGGKAQTLVWREDSVSTVNVAYLHGTERLASGMIMLQGVKEAVDAFRSEFKTP